MDRIVYVSRSIAFFRATGTLLLRCDSPDWLLYGAIQVYFGQVLGAPQNAYIVIAMYYEDSRLITSWCEVNQP